MRLLMALMLTTDGNFVIQGYTNSFGNGGIDFYLMKINSDGNIIWANTYGGEADEILPFGSYNTAQETNDGGFIFSIQSNSFDGSDSKAYFVRTNPDGTTICGSAN
jgi:hypothetical protein